MSELRPYVDSILALASATGDRDSGARLVMVEKTIADCLRCVGPDPQKQLARLEAFDTEIQNVFERHPRVGNFLEEVTDMIATRKRHLEDRIV